ncbi:hypothetical protein AVEN_83072-1 [Araneus ventricosus]|uniref:Uncharacterized protein n=1 Tax=Araneus ventricosus TaxID=182803 RepID=A0A4Y2ANX8_ARAVE|nr:hypothetical protein AVEN_83072-1 [Araneus ventricosus]
MWSLDQSISCKRDKQCTFSRVGTSLEVGAPTTERLQCEQVIGTGPVIENNTDVEHTGWKQCEGIQQPFCRTRCEEMVRPLPKTKQFVEQDERICECPQRFRKLSFPPKCRKYCNCQKIGPQDFDESPSFRHPKARRIQCDQSTFVTTSAVRLSACEQYDSPSMSGLLKSFSYPP